MTKTTNRAATHQGTCQVCARLQMLPAGKMAKHGYTVEWGYFNGTCPGSDHLPYELDKSLVEHYIPIADAQAKRLTALAKEIAAKDDPKDVLSSVYRDYKYHSVRGHLEFGEGKSGDYRAVFFVATLKGETVRERVGGFEKDLRVPAARLHQNEARTVELHAQMARSWHKDLVERAAAWKYAPEKLVEVKEESRQATLHAVNAYWSKREGRDVALCAASSRSAHGYKQTTRDRSKVTCKACLKSLAAQDADAALTEKANVLISEMVAKYGDAVKVRFSSAADQAVREIRYQRKEIDKNVRKRAADRIERGVE